MAKRVNIPYNELYKLLKEGANIKQLAARYKCSGQTIRNRLYYYKLAPVTPPVYGWDKAPELTDEDRAFLKKYDLTEFNK